MIGPLKVESAFDGFQDTAYWEKYMLNAFQFSAAKSVAELKMLQSMVFGDGGRKVPFDQFRELAEPILKQFNEVWLRVEYDLAARGAVMAQRWQELWKDRDLFPTWVFHTRRDDRVRPEHADLEGKVFRLDDTYAQQFWPPLGWNCRCEGEQSSKDGLTRAEMEPLTHNISPGFEGNVGIDGVFPITKSGSSYYELLKNANAARPEMFTTTSAPIETVYDKVQKVEREIRNNKYETLIVFDKSGKEIFNKKGGESNVGATKEETEKITKGAIFTHNHPSALNFSEKSMRRIGQSFSIDDIKSASKYDAAEMRAVTPSYTFIMQPPDKGWPHVSTITKTYNEIHEQVLADFKNRIDKKITTINQAQTLHWHLVNKRAAEKLGMKYTKFKNNE